MKRIIVPTNFSKIAWNATIHALEYSRILRAELLFIHVYEHSPNSLDVHSLAITKSISEEKYQMRKLLDKVANLEISKDLDIKYRCMEGTLFDALNQLIINTDEDLIVMGTKGRLGTIDRFFGSNTSRILKEMRAPVLVIPTTFDFSLTTPVTCAIDYGSLIKNPDLNLLEQIVNAGSNTMFKIIHIIKESKDPNKPLPLEQFQKFNVKYDEIIGSNIPALLERYSKINNSRLLVLVRREKGFLKIYFTKKYQMS